MAWHVIVFQPVLMMIDDDDVVSLIFSSFLTQDDILRNMFHLKKKNSIKKCIIMQESPRNEGIQFSDCHSKDIIRIFFLKRQRHQLEKR